MKINNNIYLYYIIIKINYNNIYLYNIIIKKMKINNNIYLYNIIINIYIIFLIIIF